jgi:hypothetical protein
MGSRSYIESNAALRLVSRKLGLYGTDAEADYTTDMAADIVVEARCVPFTCYHHVTKTYGCFHNLLQHCQHGEGAYAET